MKKFLLLLLIANCSLSYSQIAEFGNLLNKSTYNEYLSRSGDTIKIGDTLIIGIPTSDLGFTYISQGGQRVSNTLAGKSIVIDQLKTYGTKSQGFKMYAQFKGYGLVPVLIDYDTALETGEIKNPKAGTTKEQAINKLKEAKELLDLEVISETEYNAIKNKLTPIIIKEK